MKQGILYFSYPFRSEFINMRLQHKLEASSENQETSSEEQKASREECWLVHT